MSQLVKYQEQATKLETFRKIADVAIKSKCYGNMSVEEATNLMLSAADFGVSPMKAINGSFHIIKGKITMAGHLISDRIRAAGHSIKVTEHTREKCVIIGVRKDNGDSYRSEFDIEDAKLAGLLNSPTWKSYPKDMLYARAIARLGRVLFSDVVGACYSEDEGHDIAGTKADERPLHDPDEADTIQLQPITLPEAPNQPNIAGLKSILEIEEVPTEFLETYLEQLSAKKGQPAEQIVAAAMSEKFFPKFKSAYCKYLAETPVESEA